MGFSNCLNMSLGIRVHFSGLPQINKKYVVAITSVKIKRIKAELTVWNLSAKFADEMNSNCQYT